MCRSEMSQRGVGYLDLTVVPLVQPRKTVDCESERILVPQQTKLGWVSSGDGVELVLEQAQELPTDPYSAGLRSVSLGGEVESEMGQAQLLPIGPSLAFCDVLAVRF